MTMSDTPTHSRSPVLRRSKRQKTAKDYSYSTPSTPSTLLTKFRPKRRQNTPTINMHWPQGVDDNGVGTPLLPVEIYESIAKYLSRTDVQNMRLVNHEFDNKICQVLFKVVVVPFRSEIYGIATDTENALVPNSVMLQDQGMRVFQGFGPWIRRFAMSFEIDMDKLEDPPAKVEQEAITTFWGTYSWPFQVYNRFSQLEGLEAIADETRSMARALRYITQATELGLSIDGGLGFLSGPDVNSQVAARAKKLVVFGDSKFMPSKPGRKKKVKPSSAASSGDTASSDIERMLRDAGYTGERLAAAQVIIQAGRAGDLRRIERGEPLSRFSLTQLPQMVETAFNAWRRRDQPTANNGATPNGATPNGATPQEFLDLFDDLDTSSDDYIGDDRDATTQTGQQAGNQITPKPKEKELVPLKPNMLTTAQKEMLLEMEWAQSAFMQSWVIAVMDNASTFVNIKKLNVARLPKRHLNILARNDLWNSLPNLQELSLAVIPDWREIHKDETAWVSESPVTPSASVISAFQLLTDHVAHRKNITTLHFEWLCGGEYAPGLYSRNQLVLPAPVVAEAQHMVHRNQEHAVLSLPHVKHISFKNCWFTPHILNRFLKPLKQHNTLESLKFDSVSLTAHVSPSAVPIAYNLGQVAHHGQNVNNAIQAGQNAAQFGQPPAVPGQPPQPPVVVPQQNGNWLQPQRVGSWVDIIEHLTPGKTLAEYRYNLDLGPEPEPRLRQKLRKLTFKSCGYIRLPMDFDQSVLGSEDPLTNFQNTNMLKRIGDLDPFMMKANDHFFGVVSNKMPASEVAALENAWGLVVGWRKTRPEFGEWADLADDAKLDGVFNAGKGRFEGVLEVAADGSIR